MSRQLSLGIACLVLAVFNTGCQKSPTNEPAKPAFKAGAIHLKTPGNDLPELTISRDVTFITSPLNTLGEPDYYGYLNQQHKAAPADNFVIELWRCVGPSILEGKPQSWISRYFDLLGAKPPPAEGNYFIDVSQLEDLPQPRKSTGEFDYPPDPVSDDLNESSERPWRAGEFPVTEKWLAANKAPLKRLVKALDRPEYFSPYVPLSGFLLESDKLLDDGMKRAGYLLSSRAMQHAGSGDAQAALQDLMALRKLGRLVSRCAMWDEAILGVALEGHAARGEQTLLQTDLISTTQWMSYRKKLESLPQPVRHAARMNHEIRFWVLQTCLIARRKVFPFEGIAPEELGQFLKQADVDWNQVLTYVNQIYDEYVAVAKLPTHQQREAGFNAIKSRMEKVAPQLEDAGNYSWHWAVPLEGKLTDQQCAYILLFLPNHASDYQSEAEDRRQTQTDLIRLGVALRAYHDDHQTYPATIGLLAPRYISAVPVDRYTLKELKYSGNDNGCLVYSVGRNGRDDNGMTSYEDFTVDDLRLWLGDGKPTFDE